MSHHHGHGGLGPLLFVAAIAYAFGNTTARVFVGGVLIVGALFFAYVSWRVVMGTI